MSKYKILLELELTGLDDDIEVLLADERTKDQCIEMVKEDLTEEFEQDSGVKVLSVKVIQVS